MKRLLISISILFLLIACNDIITDESTPPSIDPIPSTSTPKPPITPPPSSNSQPMPSLNEHWHAFFETDLCDDFGFQEKATIVINLEQNGNTISGKLTHSYLPSNNEILTSQLSGTLKDKTITGQIDYTYADSTTVSQPISLLWDKYILSGQLRICSNNELNVVFRPELNNLVLADSYENNNNIADAKEIQLDNTYDLSIEEDDIDWFKITTDSFMVVDITTELYTVGNLDFDVFSKHNLNESRLSSVNTDPFKNKRLLSLSAGENYIRVKNSANVSSKEIRQRLNGKALYKLNLKESSRFQNPADLNYEPNDTPEQAVSIPTGYHGKNYQIVGGDVDWYSFSITENQLVKPYVYGGSIIYYEYYNDSLELIPFSSVQAPGNYFIKVLQDYSNRNITDGQYYVYDIHLEPSEVND